MNEWSGLDNKAKRAFEIMLISYGYSKKVVDKLWKWYDSSEKEGVASYWEQYKRILLNLSHQPLISEG